MIHSNVYQLLGALLDDLAATGEITGEEPEELEDVIVVFCRHKRLLRILLTLCED